MMQSSNRNKPDTIERGINRLVLALGALVLAVAAVAFRADVRVTDIHPTFAQNLWFMTNSGWPAEIARAMKISLACALGGLLAGGAGVWLAGRALYLGWRNADHRSPIWLNMGIAAIGLTAIATVLLLPMLDRQTLRGAAWYTKHLPKRAIRLVFPDRSRPTAAGNPCINNLRALQGAKEDWRLQHNQPDTAVPTWTDLVGKGKYIRVKLICPTGGTYRIGSGTEQPQCSVPGHTLTPDFR